MKEHPFFTSEQMKFLAMIFSRAYEVANIDEAEGLCMVQELFEYELASRDKHFNKSLFRKQVGYEWIQDALKENFSKVILAN